MSTRVIQCCASGDNMSDEVDEGWDQHTICSVLNRNSPLRVHEAGGRSSHGGTINFHRAPGSPPTLLDFRHRTKTMQARIVTQLNIGQPRFDTEQRPKKVLSILLELSLGLLEAFELQIECFFFRNLFWRTVFEAAKVLFSSELPFCKHRSIFFW
jgi:hypothetical protein